MISVLTGDIVYSTGMQQDTYQGVVALLKKQFSQVQQKYNAVGDIYRGDEFQIQYPTPEHAITSAILIKLALHQSDLSTKPIRCTMSLAFGEYKVYAAKPNTSTGPVFIDSGRGLDNTPRGDLSIHVNEKVLPFELILLTRFLNHQLNKLTKAQANLLSLYIEQDFADHSEMAALTGTTRQNISNRLSNIGATLVRDYIDTYNAYLNNL